MPQTVGERVREIALRKKGWTVTKLASELGVTYETFRKWERGETAPNRRRLLLMSQVLEEPPEMLLFGVDTAAPANHRVSAKAALSREALSAAELRLISNYRDGAKEDRRFLDREAAARAARMREIRAEVLQEKPLRERLHMGGLEKLKRRKVR